VVPGESARIRSLERARKRGNPLSTTLKRHMEKLTMRRSLVRKNRGSKKPLREEEDHIPTLLLEEKNPHHAYK